MATTARSPPTARRPLSSSSSSSTSSPISRGATARAAVSPRVSSPLNNSHPRRASLKGASPPLLNGSATDTHNDSLTESLKHETEQKEQLLVQVQEKDQTISNLTTETANLTSSLNAAQTRLNEFFEEQGRTETEMANRIEISEKLRSQIRELEKERRDLQRRYNEQTATFDAERQALYDNEQHLKSRIQSLSSARKEELHAAREPSDIESILEPESPEQPPPPQQPISAQDSESEPAIVTALNLELSTLSTSYTSLQSTVTLMQTQLIDLKRVNQELQEDNESYMILLRERTLNGQFDILKHVGGADDDDRDDDNADGRSVRSNATGHRSALDRVDEEDVGAVPGSLGQELERSLGSLEHELDTQRDRGESISRQPSRQGRRRTQSQSQPSTPHGESLADLPITGPGLDLAAELGRAQNRDILDGKLPAPEDTFARRGSAPGGKRSTDARTIAEVEQLKSEVKSLKDANKALSLYASKIIDRIISEEGFEHVLAVDYEQPPPTPGPKTAHPNTGFGSQLAKAVEQQKEEKEKPAKKQRPQSVILGRSVSDMGAPPSPQAQAPPQLTTFASLPPAPASTTTKANRRSMSFDWKSFSIFNKDSASPSASPHLRPLTLGKPGASPVVGARKLEKAVQEDDEDRKERERLNATMKLMGIEPAASSVLPPSEPVQTLTSQGTTPTVTRRFSLFGSRSPPAQQSPSPPVSGSPDSGVGLGIGSLTQDALVQAEAANVIAAQDSRERNLSAEMAKGGPATTFTEITRRPSVGRRSHRSGRSGGGSESGRSGSTVFSAGIQEED